MDILESFAQYVSTMDMCSQPDGWMMPVYASNNVTIGRGYGPSGENEVRVDSNLARGGIYKRLEEAGDRAFSGMLVRSFYNGTRILFHDEDSLQRNMSGGSSVPVAPVSVEISAYGISVYHSIFTSESGLAANQMLIGSALAPPSTSWIYVDVDFSGPPEQSKVSVYVDTVPKGEFTFDRNRIDSGFQASQISAISLHAVSGGGHWVSSVTAGRMSPYAPAQPWRYLVKGYAAPGNLSANPPNDATGETVENQAFADFAMSADIPSSGIEAARAFVRIAGSGGEEEALAVVELRYPDEPNGVRNTDIVYHQPVPVSMTPRLFSAPLPTDAFSSLSGAIIRARSEF
ncbi:hypothetical protein PARHAE_03256 [Paracoccus haematequi]|uniref:Uncharacterized protein n=1 Tax=Paracoccus haematequi TaxID=2491866 RepID=A0A447IRC6_9RHOB|nr:hypothetical protein [Paracoccus haematequi]VDS10045.1 hypothetical protein PARHAE_03256 [Paracoccus haematequi]